MLAHVLTFPCDSTTAVLVHPDFDGVDFKCVTQTHRSSAVLSPRINLGSETRWIRFAIHSVSFRLCQCRLVLSPRWCSKMSSPWSSFGSICFKFIFIWLCWWQCGLDTALIWELLPCAFVAMGTRLERTEVTLCGSNTELIHWILPSWKFHMVSAHSRQGIFPPYCYPNYCTHLLKHTLSSSAFWQFPGLLQDVYRWEPGFGSLLQVFQSRGL